ncbi:MAG: hypothetical protein DHS20C06_01260 [Hyphobacterium sp.]|nr:MAG: hypothetical protein DHS20C06_01260 [Hyphobacterium sp.]
MNSPPTISIVTPNYNGADFVRETIESVLDQNYPALQYVIADGASTDGSRLIFEHYRDRLASLISAPDNGHADAVNKGFALTDGEIMGWINSDDILHPGCLSQVAYIFETHPEIEWMTGRPSTMNVRSEIDYVGSVRPWSRLRFLAGDHFWIQQESTFWRRSLWDRAGGGLDTSFNVANDFDLWARFFRHAHLYSVDRMLGCFRVRPGQRSVVSLARYKREVRSILKRELEVLDSGFRDAFGSFIPKRPLELNQDELDKLDTRLRVLDSPIIRMDKVRRRTSSLTEGGGSRFSITMESREPVSDFSLLKDAHQGERCIILGNPSSLEMTDLALLKNETVFACDAMHLILDRIDWRPAYYTCANARILADHAPDIEAMLDTEPDMIAFFPAEMGLRNGDRGRLRTRDLIPQAPNRYYFNDEPGTVDDLPDSMFSTDATARVIQSHNVAITMMQLAAYLGFSDLVLVGIDLPVSRRETDQLESGIDTEDAHLTSLIDEHLRLARQSLENQGMTVRSVTDESDPGVFEWARLQSVIDQPARPQKNKDVAHRKSSGRGGTAIRANFAARYLDSWFPSFRRNLGFVIGSTGIMVFLALAAALLPEWRVWIIMTGMFGFSITFGVVVAIKMRRIVKSVLKALKIATGGEANSQLSLQQLELELDSLHAELYEMRRDLSRDDHEIS